MYFAVYFRFLDPCHLGYTRSYKIQVLTKSVRCYATIKHFWNTILSPMRILPGKLCCEASLPHWPNGGFDVSMLIERVKLLSTSPRLSLSTNHLKD